MAKDEKAKKSEQKKMKELSGQRTTMLRNKI